MWESYKRRPPRQVASAKACTHQTWHVRIWQTTSAIGMENQPRLARISRGVCALTGRQRSWPARIGQQQATSAKACTKNRGVCASGKRHRPTARNINQGLHASAVACAPGLGDFIRGLRASANDRRHRRRAARINHGVCASTWVNFIFFYMFPIFY